MSKKLLLLLITVLIPYHTRPETHNNNSQFNISNLLDYKNQLTSFDIVSNSFEQTKKLETIITDKTGIVNHFIAKHVSSLSKIFKTLTASIYAILNHSNAVFSVFLSSDTYFALTGSFDHTAVLWDISNRYYPVKSCTLVNKDLVYAGVLSSDTSFAVLCIAYGITIWDLSDKTSPTLIRAMNFSDASPDSISISSNNSMMLVGFGKFARLYDITDIKNPKELSTLNRNTETINSVVISKDNSLAITRSGKTAVLWNITNPKNPIYLSSNMSWDASAKSAVLSNNKPFAVVPFDRLAFSYNISNRTNPTYISTLSGGHSDVIYSSAITTDSSMILTGGKDNKGVLWNISDIKNPSIISFLQRHTNYINSVDINKEASIAITGSSDGTAILWNITAQDTFLSHLDLYQLQLLIKLSELKEYNRELEKPDYVKVFNSLNNKVKEKVLDFIKALPLAKKKS